jgi:hypothetical protein
LHGGAACLTLILFPSALHVFARSANDELGNCHNAISAAESERGGRRHFLSAWTGRCTVKIAISLFLFVCSVRELDFLAAGVLNGMQPFTLMKNPVGGSKQ